MENWYNDLISSGRRFKRTYSLPERLCDHLTSVAISYNVGVSDLVTYLLTRGVQQIEAGKLEIKTEPAALNRIKY